MKYRFFSCLVLFVALLVLISVIPTAAAVDYSAYAALPAADEQANAYYLCNLTQDVLIAQKNADVPICSASTVKIMAGLLFCEAFADRLSETVSVTAQMAVDFSGYCMGLQIGEQVSVKALLYAALCAGYNDAAIVLACFHSGSTAAFLSAVNQRAKLLGMNNTVFSCITGISSGIDSTLSDIVLMARAAADNALYMTVTGTREYVYPATNKQSARDLHNRNALIYDNSPGGIYSNTSCRGMHSGNTDAGGWCLATVSERDGERFLCIVMGAQEDDTRIYSYTIANQLLNIAARSFDKVTVVSRETVYASLPVENGPLPGTRVDLVPIGDLTLYIPLSVSESSLSYRVRPTAPTLSAPFREGELAGTLAVYLGDEQIGVISLVTASGTNENVFLSIMTSLSAYLNSRIFIFTAILFVILLFVWLRFFRAPKTRKVKMRSGKMRRK